MQAIEVEGEVGDVGEDLDGEGGARGEMVGGDPIVEGQVVVPHGVPDVPVAR